MSLSFYMQPKKKLLFNKPMKVGELLKLIPELDQFSFDESIDDFDPNRFYDSRLDEYICLLCGIYKKSARGFELSYDKGEDGENYYRVRVFTPSSIEDWKIALKFTRALAQKLGVKIISEQGEEFDAEDIEKFDYYGDILFGINALFNPEEGESAGEGQEEEKKESSNFFIFGINRPVAYNQEMKNQILNSQDPVVTFSEGITEIQYLESYSARQFFYKDKEDDSVFGVYVLTQSVDTILPYEPFVEFENTDYVNSDEVKEWKLNLMSIEGNPDDGDSYQNFAVVDYNEFIKYLPKEKYRFIDGAYIEVQGLSKEEMQDIVDQL